MTVPQFWALTDARGFCREHARDVAGFADGLGITLMHESALAALTEMADSRILDLPAAACPACIQAAVALERCGSTFLEAIAEPEIAQYLAGKPFLCLPHLRWLASHTRQRSVRAALAAVGRATAARLLADAGKYIAAANATDEPVRLTEDEMQVCLRLLAFLSGTGESAGNAEKVERT